MTETFQLCACVAPFLARSGVSIEIISLGNSVQVKNGIFFLLCQKLIMTFCIYRDVQTVIQDKKDLIGKTTKASTGLFSLWKNDIYSIIP